MAGVYLSFPFCAQKCTFCNFASGVFSRELEQAYYAALQAEVEAAEWSWRPETVYLGGGTPSQMNLWNLERLLAAIPGQPWAEATIEAAPGTLTVEKIRAWRSFGINRVSLGVQSFVDRELRQTGRKHTAEIVHNDCALLRTEGLDNFNIDLIAGLPHQSPASWTRSLDELQELRAPHVSVYMFEVDNDSRLGFEILDSGSRYGAGFAPSDDETAELYSQAVNCLAEIGIPRYEISNFARQGFQSKHNLKYWKQEPYLGFGADAHSFDGDVRWGNAESAAEYVNRWRKGVPVANEIEAARPEQERFFLGLRLTDGIVAQPQEWRPYDALIQRFLQEGLLEADGSVLRLTDRGVLLSNEVFQEFVTS